MIAPAPVAAPAAGPAVYAPAPPTLTCPYCGVAEALDRPDAPFWRDFRPLAVLGRFAGQLHRVFVCGSCRGRFAPTAAVPTTHKPPRDPDPRVVYDGTTLICPKCNRAEARIDPRARWQFFQAIFVPRLADRDALAACYRCLECGHVFAPRVTLLPVRRAPSEGPSASARSRSGTDGRGGGPAS